ncbi:hypothetical protein IJM86_08690 [bacterium]|nr:hypothetical protein [bacterium]
MIKNQFEQEKILLSNKDSRTSEEEQRLKVLEELLKEENAEQAQRIYEQSLKALKLTTKYTNINTILKSAFLPFFVEE